MGFASLDKLSEDLLYRIVHLLGLHDKIRLQLVSKKLCAVLMRAPPGEGLWGFCDLTETFSNLVAQDGCIDPGARRWGSLIFVACPSQIYTVVLLNSITCGVELGNGISQDDTYLYRIWPRYIDMHCAAGGS